MGTAKNMDSLGTKIVKLSSQSGNLQELWTFSKISGHMPCRNSGNSTGSLETVQSPGNVEISGQLEMQQLSMYDMGYSYEQYLRTFITKFHKYF